MKNQACKTEDGRYELWGTTPFDITERIEKEGCECISTRLLINPKPRTFIPEQLQEIRKELPNWAVKNVLNFTEKDKQELSKELIGMPNTELLQKLKYRYSFFVYSRYEEIYVYTIKIKDKQAYCINYKEVYDLYNDESIYPQDEFHESLKKYYPLIENEDWARNFGDAGIVSLKKKEDDNEIYKTYKGKNHTKKEWLAFEQQEWEYYQAQKKEKDFLIFFNNI